LIRRRSSKRFAMRHDMEKAALGVTATPES